MTRCFSFLLSLFFLPLPGAGEENLLSAVHIQTGQKKVFDLNQEKLFVFISSDCVPCQKQVREVTSHCHQLIDSVTWFAVGPRAKVKKQFQILDHKIWLSDSQKGPSFLSGTPTWSSRGKKQKGFQSCEALLKQTSFLKGLETKLNP